MSATVELSRIVAALDELAEGQSAYLGRGFCDRVEDDLRDRLLRAVHGRGAFRRFKDVVYEEGIQHDWFAHRDARLADIAREWLEADGVPYVDDVEATAG